MSALLLSACVTVPPEQATRQAATPDGQPAWIVQPTRSGAVVYGSGGSPSQDNASSSLSRARQAATADLMTGLRVRIMAETRSEISETDGAVARYYAQSVTSRVDDIALDDVRLEDTWESPNGFIYALVSLDTEAAATRLRRVYEGAMPALNRMPDALESVTQWDRFVAWHQLMVTGGEQQARNELHQLFVGRPIDPGWPAEYREWQQGYREFLSDQPIVLQPDNPLATQWAGTLSSPWSELGFPLLRNASAEPGEAWRLRLVARTEDQSDGRFQRQWVTVTAALYDEQNQRRWQLTQQSRGVAGSAERAQKQAMEAAAEALAQSWLDTLSP